MDDFMDYLVFWSSGNSGNYEASFLSSALLWLALIAIVVILFVAKEGIPYRRFSRLLKHPKFVVKQLSKIQVDHEKGLIQVPCACEMALDGDERWVISNSTIKIIKGSEEKEYQFNQMSKITMRKIRYSFAYGKVGCMYFWADEYEQPAKWKTLPIVRIFTATAVFYYNAITEDIAQEIMRRYKRCTPN